jgi:hypothetical protein
LELKNEISLYEGELTAPCLVNCIADIKKAFPSLPVGFYDILTDRLADNGFSDNRLKDAVRNVIDTCIYPTPTIAQFISFDKRVKIYTYLQYCDMVEKGSDGKNYKAIKLKGHLVPVWIHINDVEQYNIISE